MLRAGVDVFSLQKLMGHSDLQVLRRYLAQTMEDIAQAHRIGNLVDIIISKLIMINNRAYPIQFIKQVILNNIV